MGHLLYDFVMIFFPIQQIKAAWRNYLEVKYLMEKAAASLTWGAMLIGADWRENVPIRQTNLHSALFKHEKQLLHPESENFALTVHQNGLEEADL